VFGLAFNEFKDNGYFNPNNPLYLQYRQFLEFSNPSFDKEEVLNRTSSGIERKFYSAIKKSIKCETNYMPEEHHEILLLGMSHDIFDIYDDEKSIWQRYVNESGYSISWLDTIPFYPYAKGDFTLTETPYNVVNEFCSYRKIDYV